MQLHSDYASCISKIFSMWIIAQWDLFNVTPNRFDRIMHCRFLLHNFCADVTVRMLKINFSNMNVTVNVLDYLLLSKCQNINSSGLFRTVRVHNKRNDISVEAIFGFVCVYRLCTLCACACISIYCNEPKTQLTIFVVRAFVEICCASQIGWDFIYILFDVLFIFYFLRAIVCRSFFFYWFHIRSVSKYHKQYQQK